MIDPANEQLSAKQAALLLNVHPERIKQLLRAGRIAGKRLSGKWTIERAEVERFIEKGGCPGSSRKPPTGRILDKWTDKPMSRQMKYYLRKCERRRQASANQTQEQREDVRPL